MKQNEPTAADEATTFEDLDDQECLEFLGSEDVGHLGLTSGALPVVVPIRYRLVGESLLFATEAGAKLHSARRHAVACVEIDRSDPSTGTCWTVLATGRLREVPDATETSSRDDILLRAWGLPTAEHLVALDIALLRGSASTSQ
jgi:nitroimidazol reductase NimA-like FMN-containing flavoprotein (pyridoxamine 5'-phosphate oxidase superfamily)